MIAEPTQVVTEPTQDDDSAVAAAVQALRRARPVLVVDSPDREAEGDVVLAGATLTDAWMAWTIRHSSGYVCAPMSAERAERLALPPMVRHNEDSRGTAYTVTVDAATGLDTGVSAADRARTVRALANPDARSADFIRPGHVVPLRARDAGVLERPGHTEAAVDLCRIAGLPPVAAIAELVHDDGTMMRHHDVRALGEAAGLEVLTVDQLIRWRQRHDRVIRTATAELPTPYGRFHVIGYQDRVTRVEHLALVPPADVAPSTAAGTALVRMHSECLTGDVLGSTRCDCGPQLDRALARIAQDGGCLVYLRGHEGRGVGLTDKLRAYELQDRGLDTVDAQLVLGLPVDDREYGAAAAILVDLGIEHLRLLTNNPAKVSALQHLGLSVRAEPHVVPAGPANQRYLQVKRDRMGHLLPADTDAPLATGGHR